MRLKNFLWVIACLTLLAVFSLLLGLRSYQVFTGEELVALVRCEAAAKDSPYRFILLLTPITHGVSRPAEKFPMMGDQWAIGGDILKWHPWVNLLGFKTCQKLTRLSGRYLKAEAELNNPKSAYDLNGGTDSLWRWMYRWGYRLPFVEAVYGNSAHTLAQPGTQWGVYVTLSGYLVKPVRIKP